MREWAQMNIKDILIGILIGLGGGTGIMGWWQA